MSEPALIDLMIEHNRQHAEDMRDVRDRMASIERMVEATRVTGDATLREAQRTNGRVGVLEAWRAQHDERVAHDGGVSDGRSQVRAEDRERLQFVLAVIQNEYVRLAALAAGLGLIARYWPW